MIEAWVRDVLRCPACGSELADREPADGGTVDGGPVDGGTVDGGTELVCTGAACALVFPVRDGIPVLLVDEGHPSSGAI